MTDTWGIPGPVFAGLYGGLLLLPALVALARAGLLLRGRAGGGPDRPEELALLTGGRRRFAEFAVAGLLERQVIRLAGDGRLSRVKGSAPDTVGREVLTRIGKHGSSIERVCDAVAEHEAAAGLETALIGRGLLADPRKLRSTWVATAVAYWVVVALGVVRLVAGASTGHPVGILLGLLALGTAVAVFVTVKARNRPAVKATFAGRAAAEAARRSGTLVTGPAGAVAAAGLAGHPDQDVRAAVTRAAEHSAARTYSRRARFAGAGGGAAVGYYGGSSCGGGGSSCGGGGSSCGGGGGGCGG
ncbi:TIGR04222 domain-containing membrane protein [Amycolatopsis australiensis]|uniref:TIGR04222 domain-containing protein n=1 Tax=Amycolatopsis australiensis TaxID=546364 RepID=A0A1K1SXX0_9PSEU|nr:TIGR04222 domain-containing membrane protein [Amycolatopsis australiensis]SFW89224.1 TIGR04222 domain-containing protein [Amycolatopsis australiensis]